VAVQIKSRRLSVGGPSLLKRPYRFSRGREYRGANTDVGIGATSYVPALRALEDRAGDVPRRANAPKRVSANIVARTLTWGSAPRPMCPHSGHLKIGLEMCRVERMRPSMSSSSSRSPSRASMGRSSRQRRRRCSTISGNQTRCASPAATAHYLRLVPIPSGWRPSPDRRQDLSDPRDVLFRIGDFRVVQSPLQSARALRLHRPLR